MIEGYCKYRFTSSNNGGFGGTYFRDIYSNINKKWYRNSWKELLILNFMHQIIMK